jgi:crotonobetainyl-CoA:carnitine CoA-transferase CaiB-like acyl-CoA transferase
MGAEVIKVEPPTGDGYRGRLHQEETDADHYPRFSCVNRNKRSISVELHRPEGLKILEDLIRWADVLVVNFRPGVVERLGFSPERCHEINPQLIFAHLTGYGDVGPWRKRRGADIYAQSLGGTVAVQGSPGREPILGATAFVDHGTPMVLAFGIVSALYQRKETGKGTVVKTSLLETTLYMQSSSNLTDYLNGEPLVVKGGRGWAGGFPMGAYPASDGDLVTMLITNEQWETFLNVLGIEELKNRADLDTHAKRVAKRHDLYPVLDEAFRKKSRDEWAKIFADTKIIRADPALRYDEVAEHPQIQALESIITVPHSKVGAFMAIASPVTVGETRNDIRRGPPGLGEHTVEILKQLGRTPGEIDALFSDNVIFDQDHAMPTPKFYGHREKYAVNMAGGGDEFES